jgi:hypothetical protein
MHGSGQYQMILRHFVVLKSKEVLENKVMGQVKVTKEMICTQTLQSKLGQFKQQK